MSSASINKIISCRKKDLIDMVLDIDKYNEFVPWCLESKVHEKNETKEGVEIRADLKVGKKFLNETYSSLVLYSKPKDLISVTNIDGPLKYLKNEWKFKEVNNKDLPKSKIIKKETYKKESKKGTAIRKFLFWKSNKEKSSDYPSYLCYYLDYSDGRSDPIKRKLYPFEDEKLGLNHFKKLVSENIKKGWEKHGA